MSDYPRISIVILNWNGWKDTIECMDSLREIKYPNHQIIVADNDSKDESFEKLVEYCRYKWKLGFAVFEYEEPVSLEITKAYTITEFNKKKEKSPNSFHRGELILIKNKNNYGFAKGNNIAIRYALKNLKPDYILLLNNDTTVGKEFLNKLIKVAERDDQIGSLQPLLLRPEGKIIDSLGQELAGWRIADKGINSNYSEMENILHNNPEIFGVCAAAGLYRCETLKKVGLFDEDFFAIFEDVDLSWKIRLDGYKSILVPESVIYHKRGISMNISSDWKIKSTQRYHASKNWFLILIRYYPLSKLCHTFLQAPLRCTLYLLRCIYYTFRLKKTKQLLKTLLRSYKIRKSTKKNPLLSSLQQYWIQNKG